jgi:hypothetical protein
MLMNVPVSQTRIIYIDGDLRERVRSLLIEIIFLRLCQLGCRHQWIAIEHKAPHGLRYPSPVSLELCCIGRLQNHSCFLNTNAFL